MAIGAFSAQAAVVTVPGGDPGVFKPGEMELLVNADTGDVWLLSDNGGQLVTYGMKDISGDAIFDPAQWTPLGGNLAPLGNATTQQSNISEAALFGEYDFNTTNADGRVAPFVPTDPGMDAFAGHPAAYLGRMFTGGASYDSSDFRFEYDIIAGADEYRNAGNVGTTPWADVTFFSAASVVPEPATLALLGLGGLAALRRRRRTA
jgi:hypothetical protein